MYKWFPVGSCTHHYCGKVQYVRVLSDTISEVSGAQPVEASKLIPTENTPAQVRVQGSLRKHQSFVGTGSRGCGL